MPRNGDPHTQLGRINILTLMPPFAQALLQAALNLQENQFATARHQVIDNTLSLLEIQTEFVSCGLNLRTKPMDCTVCLSVAGTCVIIHLHSKIVQIF